MTLYHKTHPSPLPSLGCWSELGLSTVTVTEKYKPSSEEKNPYAKTNSRIYLMCVKKNKGNSCWNVQISMLCINDTRETQCRMTECLECQLYSLFNIPVLGQLMDRPW